MANHLSFGRLAKSPCFLEGAQADQKSAWLRIFESAMQVIGPIVFTSPLEGTHQPNAHLRGFP
jgi:hypothetical protein